jgi:hypothetical protein
MPAQSVMLAFVLILYLGALGRNANLVSVFQADVKIM